MSLTRRTLSTGDDLYFHLGAPVFSSGCTLLDCALGGGWAESRIVNLVGDKSTGKTLLAIEAGANFARMYPDACIDYIEAEAAFDREYAENVGFPKTAALLENIATVEALFEHLDTLPEKKRLVIIDSLDALTAEAELKEELGDHGYGAMKPKLLSEVFRRLARDLKSKQITLFIISQVRENIGTTMGPKHTRSGGKALDFYASQIVWLSQTGVLEKEIEKVKRTLGIKIRAKVTKNKIGMAFREAGLEILFNYGVDNLHTSLSFLDTTSSSVLEQEFGMKRLLHDYSRLKNKDLLLKADGLVRKTWQSLEALFAPPCKKYDNKD